MTHAVEPPEGFVAPSLPRQFVLVDVDGHRLGPFDRDRVIKEPDGAIVFYEEGALPMRLGVVRQYGDVLDLWPAGAMRVVPVSQADDDA